MFEANPNTTGFTGNRSLGASRLASTAMVFIHNEWRLDCVAGWEFLARHEESKSREPG